MITHKATTGRLSIIKRYRYRYLRAYVYLVTDVGKVEAAEVVRVVRGVVDLAQGSAGVDPLMLEPVRLPLENLHGVDPTVVVPGVRPRKDAFANDVYTGRKQQM